MTLDDHKVQQKQKLFREQYALDYLWPSLGMVGNAETPRKNVSFRKCAKTAVPRFFILWCEVIKRKILVHVKVTWQGE